MVTPRMMADYAAIGAIPERRYRDLIESGAPDELGGGSGA